MKINLSDQVTREQQSSTLIGFVVEIREKAIRIDYYIQPVMSADNNPHVNWTTWIPKAALYQRGNDGIHIHHWFTLNGRRLSQVYPASSHFQTKMDSAGDPVIVNPFEVKREELAAKIAGVKAEIEELMSKMPETHSALRSRNQSLFYLSRELEKLENPEAYELNKNHWESHELRM